MTYQGRVATTGNSQALALEKAFFRSHPEFASGRVEAEPIARGYVLVRAVPDEAETDTGADPVVGAYLEFLGEQMAAHPHLVQPLSADLLARARDLVGDDAGDPDEDLGEDDLLG